MLTATLLAATGPAMAEAAERRQAFVYIQPQSSGTAGSQVGVVGLGFEEGRVEVRWNGLDGPQLGASSGPDFTTIVTVPQAPTGLYTLVVLARDVNGVLGTAATANFLLTDAASTPPQTAAAKPEQPPSADGAAGLTPEVTRTPPGLWALIGLVLGGLGGAVLWSRRRNKRGIHPMDEPADASRRRASISVRRAGWSDPAPAEVQTARVIRIVWVSPHDRRRTQVMIDGYKIRRRRMGEEGFTLIELLVVIIILGIIAAVVVFAVGGVGDKGQSASCKIDTRTLRTAEEAYAGSAVGNGNYGTEAQLVTGGFLSEQSTYHDISDIVAASAGPPPVLASFKIRVQDERCGAVGGEVGNPATNL